jgi:SAM-dependent methyltransferase
MAPFRFNTKYISMQSDISHLIPNDYDNFAPAFSRTLGADYANLTAAAFYPIMDDYYRKNKPEWLKVLDICCGTGDLLGKLAWMHENIHRNWEAYGIDKSKIQILYAKNEYPQHPLNTDFKVRDALTYKSDIMLDFILMTMDAINHIPGNKWQDMFTNVHKNLKDGGIFLFDFNKAERYTKDLKNVESIITKDWQYYQLPSNHHVVQIPDSDDDKMPGKRSTNNAWIEIQMLMYAYIRENDGWNRYDVLTQHTAPEKVQIVYDMLERAGFKEINDITNIVDSCGEHLINKNRIFLKCTA